MRWRLSTVLVCGFSSFVSFPEATPALAICKIQILFLLLLANEANGRTHMSLAFVDAFSGSNKASLSGQHSTLYRSSIHMSPTRARLKTKLEKLKQNHFYPIPDQYASNEVAGISSGISLLKELRRCVKHLRQQPLKDTLDKTRISFLLNSEGRRREKIKARLKRLGYKFSPKKDGGDEFENTSTPQAMDDEEDEDSQYSLDGLRATAGVLRTRIRLKQDELKELDVLMRDVVREMRMEEFLKKESHNNEIDLGSTNAVSSHLGDDGRLGESEIDALNNEWKNQRYNTDQMPDEESQDIESDDDVLVYEFQLDLMKTRAAEVQSQILLDRIRLQRLERRILCCESTELGLLERAVGNTLDTLNESEFLANPITVIQQRARKFANTFGESLSVLFRRIDRESYTSNENERNLESLSGFVVKETSAGIRIVGNLLSNPSQLTQLIDPETPTLIPHVPAILSRLDRLESHVAPILSRVLNNKQHLKTIEPYLPEILERYVSTYHYIYPSKFLMLTYLLSHIL